MAKKELLYNLRVGKEDLDLAREFCENNYISLPNEIRKIISQYAKKQKEINNIK